MTVVDRKFKAARLPLFSQVSPVESDGIGVGIRNAGCARGVWIAMSRQDLSLKNKVVHSSAFTDSRPKCCRNTKRLRVCVRSSVGQTVS